MHRRAGVPVAGAHHPYLPGMVRRRGQVDPELAEVARERLHRVLEGTDAGLGRPEHRSGAGRGPGGDGPRRARPPAAAPAADLDQPATDQDQVVGDVGLEDLAAPRRFTRWHLGVLVALVLLGLLWGGWSLLRARPVAIAAPTLPAPSGLGTTVQPPVPPSSAAVPTTPSPDGARLVVHVLGAVRRPGLVRLPDRSRVQDAIDAAGGLARDADPAELNLAQPLADGEQVVIGTRRHAAGEVRAGGTGRGDPVQGGGRSSGPGTTSGGARLDLNRATTSQLEELPGVGPVTAQKIVGWREQHGRFSRPEELQEVDGIGPRTYAEIAPHVRV